MLTPDKSNRPRREPGVRVNFYFQRRVLEQIDELADALHVPRSSVLAQAVARMYGQEPLLQNGKKVKK